MSKCIQPGCNSQAGYNCSKCGGSYCSSHMTKVKGEYVCTNCNWND